MIQNNTPEELFNRIKEADTIAMSLHLMPDGDSLGSTSALAYVFEKHFGKQVTIVSSDQTGDYLEPFLPFHDIKFGKTLDDVDADLYVVSDGCQLFRFGVKKEIANDKLVFVDHHDSPPQEGALSYVFPEKSSACSVVFDLVKAWGIEFDEELAKRLILGMYTDTGGFKYGKSLTEDIKKLNYLLEHTSISYENMLQGLTAVSYKYKKLMGLVLQHLEIYGVFGLSCIALEEAESLGLSMTDLRGGIGAIQDIKEIDVACTLIEIGDNKVKGSFRSQNGESRKFAEILGGGGHDNAAAFILENISLEDAKKKVLELVKQ